MDNELADVLRYCRLERRLADLTCKAYERDVRAWVAFLRERGIEELAEVRAPQLRELLAKERKRGLRSEARRARLLR